MRRFRVRHGLSLRVGSQLIQAQNKMYNWSIRTSERWYVFITRTQYNK